MLLALDPGERKIGWALVQLDGTPVAQGIMRVDSWNEALLQLPRIVDVTTLVLGDGTESVNIREQAARLLPRCAVAVVGEAESTVEGWQLKRAETCGGNPLKLLAFTLAQLWNTTPVDDYAARVLAQRYLAQRS